MPELLHAIPVLAARDVPADVAFWVNTLGFGLLFSVDGFAGVARDGVQLYISAVDDQAVADGTQAWIGVADLDGLHAEWTVGVPGSFADPSGPAMTEISDRPWGREFAVRDRAGNCVHFIDGAQ
ncbi:VOC family protein [Plantactinospora sp. KLBMP9567]|uniref:bleomycin resistance protein n=1 Tax=unclassified Plantactinospora TaxID=2631981 RepID=UPI002981A23A|nr:VOC family protein [Plantactinospora sp. KLBMP9567]MDW5324879.1 VOC family protein [Plantactinospora sp. KLBMP9567]